MNPCSRRPRIRRLACRKLLLVGEPLEARQLLSVSEAGAAWQSNPRELLAASALSAGTSGVATPAAATSSIAGRIFNDTNGNGLFDGSELGTGGVTVFLDNNDNQQYDPASDPHVTTAANGTYTFNNLAAAIYSMGIVMPASYHRSGPLPIYGTQGVAFDQPQINALLQPAAGGQPYSANIVGIRTFNISGFLDTGASGIVISSSTQDSLGVPLTPGETFSDVAIGGSTEFDVSQTLNVRLASSNNPNVDNLAIYQTVYNQAYSGMRTEVGPTNVQQDPLAEPLDVFGMPVMIGKTVVIDPKPVNDLSDFIHTFIYNPGTPFHPNSQDSDPGIPTTSHHVALSYGSFDRFSQVAPAGAQAPSLAHNPFLGPNPVRQIDPTLPPDNTPPVSLDYGGLRATGSFLLDTGAVASFISNDLAAKLHVRYTPGTEGTDDPQLETFDPAHPALPGTPIATQFQLPIQGIGGAVTVVGFYLDDLLVHTVEGGASDSALQNLRYVHAPVYVHDVSVQDPVTEQTLTLDGVFGMNYLVASAALTADGNVGDTTIGPYNWLVFNEPAAQLGLDVPAPAQQGFLSISLDDNQHTTGIDFAISNSAAASSVVGRNLFYNGSARYDTTGGPQSPLPFADDNAIASDKTAYRPGTGTATFANVSSYWRGINGLMIDLAGPHSSLSASDFIFKVGNNNSPSTWATAPAPAGVTVRTGAGVGGSDRIEITWANNVIQKTWLEVVVKGNDALGGSNTRTGLAQSDVFYFASSPGDTGSLPDDATTFRTTSTDEVAARSHPVPLAQNIPITNIYDFSRDGKVDSTDQIVARGNVNSNATAPKRLSIGSAGPFAPASDESAASPQAALANAANNSDTGVSSALAVLRSKPIELSTSASLAPPPPDATAVITSVASHTSAGGPDRHEPKRLASPARAKPAAADALFALDLDWRLLES